VFATDPASGLTIAGPLKALDAERMTIGDFTIEPAPRLRVERDGDSVLDGAAIGFVIGGLAGISIGSEGCLHGSQIPCFLGGGLAYGLMGALIDEAHHGRTRVFHGAAASRGRPPALSPESAEALPRPSSAIDFTRLPIRVGDVIAVTRPSGTLTQGRLTAIEHDALSIDGMTFDARSTLRVERVGDPVWDGFLKGAAVGGGLVAIEGGRGGSIAAGLLIYGAIGAAIDKAVTGRRTVLGSVPVDALGRTVRVVPEFDRHTRAVALAWRF